jgi:hypothetical protein
MPECRKSNVKREASPRYKRGKCWRFDHSSTGLRWRVRFHPRRALLYQNRNGDLHTVAIRRLYANKCVRALLVLWNRWEVRIWRRLLRLLNAFV